MRPPERAPQPTPGNEQLAALLDHVRRYLSEPRCAVLSTLDAGGAPQQAVVHYLLGPDHLLVNGRPDRRWIVNLRRDPRVALVVHDPEQPLHWVGLRGTAQSESADVVAVADAMSLARRYGEDPAEYEHLERVSFKIIPVRVFEYGANRVTPAVPAPPDTSGVCVRAAGEVDWPAIWAFMRVIVAAGETFSWDQDISEQEAKAKWMHQPPGRTLVAVDVDARVVGTAEMEPNHGGGGAHVATAGFMVDSDCSGRGVGRALCQAVLDQARIDGYRAMQFNAVVETNTRAVQLWHSLGFQTLARIPEGYRHPRLGYVGLLVMHQQLR